jgi:uncharacterized protein involved in response to NO
MRHSLVGVMDLDAAVRHAQVAVDERSEISAARSRAEPLKNTVTAIPRYRPHSGPALLSAGFRPFFLLSGLWSALAVPLWLFFLAGEGALPSVLPPLVWHVHEMVFGFGAATVAGFMLTAIPNWTGRMPVQGGPLAGLAILWLAGRVGVLLSAKLGADAAAVLDLAFPLAFLGVVAREITAGRNWRNLPMLAALASLLLANLLVHLEAVGITATAELGSRLGVATLLMLISIVGGRIIPSFTRNWLAKQRPEVPSPVVFDSFDRTVLAVTALALALWVIGPAGPLTPWAALTAGLVQTARLARWRGLATWREPLVWVLHLGYGWLALGFVLLALSGAVARLPQTAALHALTAGAIGTMTLAVMTRASLGHTGRPLAAGPGTTAIYLLVTLAAALRLSAPLAVAHYLVVLSLAGAAWSSAFGLFVLIYARPLLLPGLRDLSTRTRATLEVSSSRPDAASTISS